MTDPINQRTETPLHLTEPAHRRAPWWLAAIVGFVALLLAIPAVSHAEEPNPNNYNCIGKHRRRRTRRRQRRTAGPVHVLLQRPDHRLPAAVADPA